MHTHIVDTAEFIMIKNSHFRFGFLQFVWLIVFYSIVQSTFVYYPVIDLRHSEKAKISHFKIDLCNFHRNQ